MRIAFFTDTFLPVHDGVAHVVEGLAAHLVAQGHPVTVFTARYPGGPSAERLPSGVEVRRAASHPLPHYPGYRNSVFPLRLLAGTRFGDSFDVVHVHTPFAVGTTGFLAARRWGLPLVGTFHTNFRDMRSSLPSNVLTDLFFRVGGWYADGLYWRCDATTAPTESARDTLVRETGKSYRRPVEVIPNGIETERFHAKLKEPDWGASLRAGGRPLVTFFGRLTRDKGVHTFLDALASLPPDPAFLGVVAGGGVEEEAMRARVGREDGLRGRVVVTGRVTEEAKPALLAQSRIFVLPSVADTSSLALLEAMASGAACVVTRVGGPSHLVQDGQNALLVDPTDARSIGAAVTRLLQEPALADRLGRAGAAYVNEHASIDRMAREFVRLYGTCVERRRAREEALPRGLPLGTGRGTP